ncbi:MAG: efflux RND transporter permease subunit [Planctomycetia bacterium]|nr:efflux RND transporter permease subunit [Planctomycetia bacterium]
MVHRLIAWAVHNRLVVILTSIALASVGIFALLNINVEAYPDPAPAIVEVVAQYPGASAEEVERQVTIPLEIALAGMPGLDYSRSKSLFGLSHLRNQFSYSTDYFRARLEVLNRLNTVDLPPGVQPEIAPTSPTGEIYRYILKIPKDAQGKDVYTLYDLKSLNDWKLEKEFRRVQRIADVVSFGGAVKRYEIQPDPARLKQYGITLEQLETAITQSNANVGGDYLRQGDSVQAVRGLGLIGGGQDPTEQLKPGIDPKTAGMQLRSEESRRLREIRQIVLTATNNVPIKISDVVEGGRHLSPNPAERHGVVVGSRTRAGRVAASQPKLNEHGEEIVDEQGNRLWEDNEDVVQGIVLLRKGEKSMPALADVQAKVKQLNETPGELLPGVNVDTIYDRTNLIHRTTTTVRENVLVGIGLVIFILLVFLNHTRSALIVALNIPLALLFAFAMLYLRGQSANLLSLGAVDFGIIVDSSVIMVEAIFRRLSSGEDPDLPFIERILRATGEVERSLFFSTLIMVCALLPLFTMSGPEGQIFGPMADAYAFALAGALLFALTLSPVLCRIFMQRVTKTNDNVLVRGLKEFYLRQLDIAMRHRLWVLAGFAGLFAVTVLSLPFLGREFMPALEEGNIYIRGTFPVKVALDEVVRRSKTARILLRKYPEVQAVLCQMGRPDDGTDPTGFYNAEFQVPLKHEDEWPKLKERSGWLRVFGMRSRTKNELIEEMQFDLDNAITGVDWNFSQQIRDNVMETLSGVKGENSIKIFGPDLDELERIAKKVRARLVTVRGIENVGIFPIKGQSNLEFAIDREKCAMWNVSVAQVQDALQTAVAGKAFTQMVEGERTFDITVRWPDALRKNKNLILDIPVDVIKNRVIADNNPLGGMSSNDLDLRGTSVPLPAFSGSSFNTTYNNASVPRRRLLDLVVPLDEHGVPDRHGNFVRSGASTIAREQGKRMIAIKFSVRNRDLASAVAEAQSKVKGSLPRPYRAKWSGEFQEMNEAIHRLVIVVALSLVLILILLYLALGSVLDVAVVFANVVVLSIGGAWALILTASNFNISAGVGFISILGVGMMNGLILVSGFNQRRAHGMPLPEAIRDGLEKRIRPLTMTCLTAIFGMLPAAFSTRIGSQTQQPLAIVVVGGMITTMLLMNLMPVFYSFYGHREPHAGATIGH